MLIKAAVPVRNRENFIGAYLEMLIDFGVTPIVSFGTESWVNHANEEDNLADKTEKILDTYFPDIKRVSGEYSHHRDSINACLKVAGHYDLILVNDCDMFITKDDWNKFIEFVSKENYNVYSINFETMIQEYYFDWRYGKPAMRGGDPPILAMKQNVDFIHMTKTSNAEEIVWNEEGPKYHHMRFCNKNRQDKRCAVPLNTKDYTEAPKEISDRLERWQEILKTL